MRQMIVRGSKGRPAQEAQLDIEDNWVQENHLREIKNLRNLIAQRDNEINLLLNVIN